LFEGCPIPANLLHVHVPYQQLEASIPFLVENRLQPEIAFKGSDLDRLTPDSIPRLGRQLADSGLGCTLHAPFMDLNPGSPEPLVYSATRIRFEQTLDAAEAFGAKLVVFHPGYDPWRYAGQDSLWLEHNLRFWPPLLERAARFGCMIALENIFERKTETLAALLNQLDSPQLGHCFDVGHWNLFSELPLSDWFSTLGPHLVHLHLHDNHGELDDHLPIGEGGIDFSSLFSQLATFPRMPSMTLEAHTRSDLLRSLKALRPYLLSADSC